MPFINPYIFTAFTPVTNDYTSGSGNETIPSGATSVTITADGGGTGGGRSSAIGANDATGGPGGGRAVLTRAVLVGEWGTTLAYAVGAGGASSAVRGIDGTAGGASTVTGTLNGGAISISAGQFTVTGGDTNTAGSAGTTGNGTVNGNGGNGAGGGTGFSPGSADKAGGGATYQNSVSAEGVAGRIRFAWI